MEGCILVGAGCAYRATMDSPQSGSSCHAESVPGDKLGGKSGQRGRLPTCLLSMACQLNERDAIVYGGETGIRTQVRVAPKHAFQACAFSHSAISPQSGVPS